MSIVLFWIGFVGIPIFLVLAFLDYRKKSGKMKRNLYLAGASFILFLIGIAMTPEAKVETQTASSEVSQEEADQLNEDIEAKETELSEIETKVKDNQEAYDAAMAIVNDKENAEKELTDLNSAVDSKKGEITDLNNDIKAKEKELALLTGKVQQKKEAPKSLSAGKFTVGTDIPAGRYKVTSNGGSGNFFINEGMDANVIIGGGFGLKEYITHLNDGDAIDINFPAKFTPIE
ncbi:hypothetical protein [Bacillus sp. V59.32b]|uniref:hypothetical protein n=1 Tax=Bacillus sp. V59.32b TaxID=1758642 RepID=UPI000E3E4CD3|nr:hypothetical protein [Bacillus sp. V59.32b]RFU68404.1 hypothetical protein D0463_05120 [Bacillus sp. V59.32b]